MDPTLDQNLDLYFYKNRLATYSGWPFDEECACTSENMAQAGFIHTPSDNSPDVVQCFFCCKELEGWEPQDDPVKEHRSHSPACNFILLKKAVEELTVEEFLKLQKERQKFHIKKTCNQAIEKFEVSAKSRRGDIARMAMEG
ncbi:baculoviral IAP repeat-containing protein 5.2 [Astyanax mexicanus]|uniref:Baculoviral IAP repeat-containing protein 5.2-like n=2 Tax=Astyanax mexicanus TaxID=7994 RepID=A0A8T2L5G3_ASTMX|nr:baculoviral IAP repeat-containing protein 5.2 [Astyanax mexicanus]KAG9264596.1 baculoviral IAP repeat-containing protein 5.2-like [Astyanax mexicanus]